MPRPIHADAPAMIDPTGGDPYIVLEGGLIQNEPALPVIDLDLLDCDVTLPGDRERATDMANLARHHGLTSIAERFEAFADTEHAPTLPGL